MVTIVLMTCNNSPNAPFPFLSNAPPIMPPVQPIFLFYRRVVESYGPSPSLAPPLCHRSYSLVTHLTLAHTFRRKHHGSVTLCIPPSIPISSIIHPVISRRSSSVSASASAHLTRVDHYYTLAVGSGRAVLPNAGLASHRRTSSRSSTASPTGPSMIVRPRPRSSCPCPCSCPLCSCVCRVSPGLALCWYTR